MANRLVRRSRKGMSKPKPIGGVVGKVLDELGLDAAQEAFRIGELWEEAVGPDVARHCRPVAVRGHVLEAEVDSSVWCQQLQMEREALLAALRETLGPSAPTDLRLRVGYPSGRRS
jgi:predicted nucleic acid-binding Zn ribbon protein